MRYGYESRSGALNPFRQFVRDDVTVTDEIETAWDKLHAATPAGWFVGRPGQRHGGQWVIYAFDTTEKANIAGAVGSGPP